jgi:hypothetical protein
MKDRCKKGQKRARREARFWNRVTKQADGCWLYSSSTNRGYAHVSLFGRAIYAHRASWILAHGEIPPGMQVCHRCDVRHCVNPDHLWLGTAAENIADRDAKGRHRPVNGERHGSVKLTDAQIAELRARASAGEQQRSLATAYGIAESYVSRIVRGVRRAEETRHDDRAAG